MVKRNLHLDQIQKNYLFVEVEERKAAFREKYPEAAEIISLGIGDTTEPIPPAVTEGFKKRIEELSTREGYSGYPKVAGTVELRKRIAHHFFRDLVEWDEVFVSDGSRPDFGRLIHLFPEGTRIAVQDPIYPAYIDQIVIMGLAGTLDTKTRKYSNITYLPCTPANGFFPDLSLAKDSDVIIFCSPNNPTGCGYTREQLQSLVDFAKAKKKLVLFDAAYGQFIDPKSGMPSTIFQIPGGRDVAIETGSFSKPLGFTGVRLGWTVCPKELKFEDGHSVHQDWTRISGTYFNGPSNIAEAGATAAFTPEGLKDMGKVIETYMNNARRIRKVMTDMGFTCYGGEHAPYVWVYIPGQDSWKSWEQLFHAVSVVTTPGLGFGSEGEEFIRISGFANPADVDVALERIVSYYTPLVEKYIRGKTPGKTGVDVPSSLQGV